MVRDRCSALGASLQSSVDGLCSVHKPESSTWTIAGCYASDTMGQCLAIFTLTLVLVQDVETSYREQRA